MSMEIRMICDSCLPRKYDLCGCTAGERESCRESGHWADVEDIVRVHAEESGGRV